MKAAVLAASALALGAFTAPARQDQDLEVEVIPVSGSVSMLVGFGGNIGISNGDDGVLMIDTQFANIEQPIRKAIAKITEGNPAFVVNTHWHGDHVGGNLGFGRDGYLVAHQNVRARMKVGGRGNGPADPAALPDLTYDDGMTMHYNGEPVHLVHMPTGHTDGDTVVFFTNSKVVHMGDLMFNGMFPFIDLDSGGTIRGYVGALRRVHEMIDDETKVIPGHGPLASRADIAKCIRMIEVTLALVEERMASGMTAEEIAAAGMPDAYADWTWNFIPTERWLATVYRGLTEEKRAAEQKK